MVAEFIRLSGSTLHLTTEWAPIHKAKFKRSTFAAIPDVLASNSDQTTTTSNLFPSSETVPCLMWSVTPPTYCPKPRPMMCCESWRSVPACDTRHIRVQGPVRILKDGLPLIAWRQVVRSTLASISTPWVVCAERVLLESLALTPSRKVCRRNVNRIRVNKVLILLDRKRSVFGGREVCQAARVLQRTTSFDLLRPPVFEFSCSSPVHSDQPTRYACESWSRTLTFRPVAVQNTCRIDVEEACQIAVCSIHFRTIFQYHAASRCWWIDIGLRIWPIPKISHASCGPNLFADCGVFPLPPSPAVPPYILSCVVEGNCRRRIPCCSSHNRCRGLPPRLRRK